MRRTGRFVEGQVYAAAPLRCLPTLSRMFARTDGNKKKRVGSWHTQTNHRQGWVYPFFQYPFVGSRIPPRDSSTLHSMSPEGRGGRTLSSNKNAHRKKELKGRGKSCVEGKMRPSWLLNQKEPSINHEESLNALTLRCTEGWASRRQAGCASKA